MFVAVTGLGAIVMTAGRRFDATTVVAMLIFVMVLAFTALAIVRYIDRALTHWLPATAREALPAQGR
jgi:ABC-type nitrate/sulfonate/bicarbonate transport system permease component